MSHSDPPTPPAKAKARRPDSLKRLLRLLEILLFLVILGGGGAVWGFWHWAGADAREPGAARSIEVVVEPGDSLRAITRKLDEAGVAGPWQLTALLAMVQGTERSLQAGRHRFAPGVPPKEALRQMAEGAEAPSIRVTLPEGWTSAQMAARLTEKGILDDPSDFLGLCVDAQFVWSLGVPGDLAEGYLFPDTYLFAPESSAEAVVRRLTGRFLSILQPPKSKIRPHVYPLSRAETVVLASIIQREARGPDEMKTISSVYHNRLRSKKRLESCATVRFALDQWNAPLRLEDLRVDSPYNTYRYSGLPPAPICNPGADALGAASEPEKSDFLFYVYKGDGRHVFSRTLREHEAARRRYKDAWAFSAKSE